MLIRWFRKGLRHLLGRWRLSPNVARDPFYSHARSSDGPFLAPTLGRLSVSLRLGYEVLASLFRSQPPRVGFRKRSELELATSLTGFGAVLRSNRPKSGPSWLGRGGVLWVHQRILLL